MRRALLSFVLLAAACSGGDDSPTSASTVVDSTAPSTVPATVDRDTDDGDVGFAPGPVQPRITTTTTTTTTAPPTTTTTTTTTTTAPTTTTTSTTTTRPTTTTTTSTTTTIPRRALAIQGSTSSPPAVFAPTPLDVTVGTRVTVTNRDDATHTWTADNDTWNSGALAENATFSHTFTRAGTFTYACTIHPTMTGRVNVT